VEPELEYDPTANRATLVPYSDAGWVLWLERPDAAPAKMHLSTRNNVGDAIDDARLTDQDAVIGYFERCLIEVGYSVARDDPVTGEFIAAWTLAPGQN
jgi:hypothetical protein